MLVQHEADSAATTKMVFDYKPPLHMVAEAEQLLAAKSSLRSADTMELPPLTLLARMCVLRYAAITRIGKAIRDESHSMTMSRARASRDRSSA